MPGNQVARRPAHTGGRGLAARRPPIQLAQAVREGKVATVRGRGGELLIAQDELERVRTQDPEAARRGQSVEASASAQPAPPT
jgi:hypothetical protein